MKRKDLARFGRFQIRSALVVVVLVLVGFYLFEAGILQKIVPGWSSDSMMPWITGVATVALVLISMRGFVGLPKCPHCRAMLTGWLLHIAVASGNCGMCGERIADD